MTMIESPWQHCPGLLRTAGSFNSPAFPVKIGLEGRSCSRDLAGNCWTTWIGRGPGSHRPLWAEASGEAEVNELNCPVRTAEDSPIRLASAWKTCYPQASSSNNDLFAKLDFSTRLW